MFRGLVLIIALSAVVATYADEFKFPVTSIPEELKKDANAVIREDRKIFDILSKSSATYYVYKVITILNEKGNDYATEVIGYDKMSKISGFSAYLYDANGKVIKKVKNNEIIIGRKTSST